MVQYLSHLQREYKLRKLPKPKPLVTGLDDLYHLLYTLWVLDESVFADEHQRTLVATGILASVYFGVRLVSLFDTRVKVDDPGSAPDIRYEASPVDSRVNDDRYGDSSRTYRATGRAPAKKTGSRRTRKRHNSSTDMSDTCDSSTCSDNTNSLSDYSRDIVDSTDVDSDSVAESTTGSDSQSITDDEAASYTDDDYDGGDEETGAFLYRHFTVFLVKSPVAGKPNYIFMKATLLHTKGEEKNPRMSVDYESQLIHRGC